MLNLTLDDLDGILITHEHIDHVRGLVTLAKKCPALLYATFGTAAAIQYPEPRLRAFAAGKEFTIKDLHVRSFRTSHDAKESVGYRIESGAGSLAVLTQRILSEYGHLSNDAAAEFAIECVRAGTSDILLAHLSDENNSPELAEYTVGRALQSSGLSVRLATAPRDTISEVHVCRRSPSFASEN